MSNPPPDTLPDSTRSRPARHQFYVAGLPRSRTAWLSVVLSDWRAMACLHEPLVRLSYIGDVSVDQQKMTAASETAIDRASLEHLLSATRCPNVGISDSGLPVVAPDLPEAIPGPILVVWRDPEEVIDSLTSYIGGDRDVHAGGVALMHERLSAFVSRYTTDPESGPPRLQQVHFDELEDVSVVRSIWRHLLPAHVPFQRRRVESLMRMRIDPDPAYVLEGATDSAIEQMGRAFGVAGPQKEA